MGGARPRRLPVPDWLQMWTEAAVDGSVALRAGAHRYLLDTTETQLGLLGAFLTLLVAGMTVARVQPERRPWPLRAAGLLALGPACALLLTQPVELFLPVYLLDLSCLLVGGGAVAILVAVQVPWPRLLWMALPFVLSQGGYAHARWLHALGAPPTIVIPDHQTLHVGVARELRARISRTRQPWAWRVLDQPLQLQVDTKGTHPVEVTAVRDGLKLVSAVDFTVHTPEGDPMLPLEEGTRWELDGPALHVIVKVGKAQTWKGLRTHAVTVSGRWAGQLKPWRRSVDVYGLDGESWTTEGTRLFTYASPVENDKIACRVSLLPGLLCTCRVQGDAQEPPGPSHCTGTAQSLSEMRVATAPERSTPGEADTTQRGEEIAVSRVVGPLDQPPKGP